MELEAQIGQPCLYFDEDKLPNAAIIAHVHDKIHGPSGKPVCNLATFRRDGRVANRTNVEPAYHDGSRWHLINKWALSGIVPKDEYDFIPLPKIRGDGKRDTYLA